MRTTSVRKNPPRKETLGDEARDASTARFPTSGLRAINRRGHPRCNKNDRPVHAGVEVALLKQVKGVGTLSVLTFLLILEDAQRFRKSREVGCYLGLQSECFC